MTEQHKIITFLDQERWPLLEMESMICSMPLNSDDEQVIAYMDQILNDLNDQAAGLAAIQVGYPRRIFMLRNGRDLNGNIFNNVYINPVLTNISRTKKLDVEACLSIPGMQTAFPRPKSVTLQYQNISGDIVTEEFVGFWARAVMHEMDHLNGVLITKHANLVERENRTSFGMVLSPHRLKVIERRRAKKKRAKLARRKGRN